MLEGRTWLGGTVSGSIDKTVRETSDHDMQKVLNIRVNTLAMLADGCVISGADDCTVRVWNPENRNCDIVLRGHTQPVISLAYGRRIISGSYDHTIRLWNPDRSTTNVVELAPTPMQSFYAARLPNGRVVACSWDKTDADPSDDVVLSTNHAICCLAVLSDGRIVSGSDDGRVIVWNPSRESPGYVELVGHHVVVSCLALLADDRIVSGSHDMTVRIWNAETGTCEILLHGQHREWVTSLVVLSDQRIASGSFNGDVVEWNPERDKRDRVFLGDNNVVTSVVMLPDGRVYSPCNGSVVSVWNSAKTMLDVTLLDDNTPSEDIYGRIESRPFTDGIIDRDIFSEHTYVCASETQVHIFQVCK
jgi:WD40 repeat protein